MRLWASELGCSASKRLTLGLDTFVMADDAPDVEPTNLRNDAEVKATPRYYHLALIAA